MNWFKKLRKEFPDINDAPETPMSETTDELPVSLSQAQKQALIAFEKGIERGRISNKEHNKPYRELEDYLKPICRREKLTLECGADGIYIYYYYDEAIEIRVHKRWPNSQYKYIAKMEGTKHVAFTTLPQIALFLGLFSATGDWERAARIHYKENLEPLKTETNGEQQAKRDGGL